MANFGLRICENEECESVKRVVVGCGGGSEGFWWELLVPSGGKLFSLCLPKTGDPIPLREEADGCCCRDPWCKPMNRLIWQ